MMINVDISYYEIEDRQIEEGSTMDEMLAFYFRKLITALGKLSNYIPMEANQSILETMCQEIPNEDGFLSILEDHQYI